MVRIVVDGMGGDDAPRSIVKGAALASEEYHLQIILVGQEERLKDELAKTKFSKGKISIHPASEVVEMHEPASLSIRRKKDSSIAVSVDLLKEGKADALVTAGNTGAAVAAATLKLRMLEGIERAGIAIPIPTLAGHSLLIDAGANIDSKPKHLLQYAVMGGVYMNHVLGIKNPKIGLLNIGEEETKGTNFIKESYRLLSSSGINFIGNIEGKDIFTGNSDCIICDGFIGNVVLKVAENLAETIAELLKRELKKSFLTRLGAVLAKSGFLNLKKKMDYAEYGGALLLGVNGRYVISHGSSSPKAIKNAIRVAGECVNHHVNQHILERLANQSPAT